MDPQNDRITDRLAQIRAREAELDAEEARAAAAPPPVVERREGSTLRSALFMIVTVVIALALTGSAVTLSRLAGRSMDDTTRTGKATVLSCVQHGPISTKGFGYWDACTASFDWNDGQQTRMTVSAVFTSDDIGKVIEVGDAGRYRQSQQLARADDDYRPWLRWIGYGLGFLALVPVFLIVMIVRASFRRKR
ncbi:hypothetical protein Aab01nite_44530 [Paractinoplanes abujensis]|uniref:Uncharacterized protein n=1 Tax=Paractinoplanes abujensis TaxID=882441 RepID=A0A7W7CK88_9ACTN|nr:DUF6346 domain-containing protein [Actinoplanes abujensis]MBB4690091.1 hypothetical protein [Actinoplanes abujensis]GID20863.1 hypothetical protein Aab01nite_44530 [Actinoplanes abujensis]